MGGIEEDEEVDVESRDRRSSSVSDVARDRRSSSVSNLGEPMLSEDAAAAIMLRVQADATELNSNANELVSLLAEGQQASVGRDDMDELIHGMEARLHRAL